jgi:dihydrofolate reductase
MRKIVGGIAVSVDGYIGGPNGEYDWIVIDKEFDFSEHMKRFDSFFMGRKTYEMIMPLQGGSRFWQGQRRVGKARGCLSYPCQNLRSLIFAATGVRLNSTIFNYLCLVSLGYD